MKQYLEHVLLADQAYESSSELRRRAQLKTEETIAELKVLNGYDINDDESVLSSELQKQIEEIYATSEALIEKTETYEKSLVSESETAETKTMLTEILAELDAKKEIADKWTKTLNLTGIKDKQTLKIARVELNGFKLKEINEKIALLPMNAKKLDFVESNVEVGKKNGQKIGNMQLKETISFDKLNILKFREVETKEQSFTLSSRIFEILDNGFYIIAGYSKQTKMSHLFTFDPIKKIRINEVTFDNRIELLFSCNKKIALFHREYTRMGLNSTIKVLDENLNVIKEKKIAHQLQSVDHSYLYCTEYLMGVNGVIKPSNLVLYDWNLNETKTDIAFQLNKPNEAFYLNFVSLNGETDYLFKKITRLEKKDSKYVVSLNMGNVGRIMIFSETGTLLKEINHPFNNFQIDSRNNIVLAELRIDMLTYFDLNGEMLKKVILKRTKNNTLTLKYFKMDSSDRLYFIQ